MSIVKVEMSILNLSVVHTNEIITVYTAMLCGKNFLECNLTIVNIMQESKHSVYLKLDVVLV